MLDLHRKVELKRTLSPKNIALRNVVSEHVETLKRRDTQLFKMTEQ